MVQEALSFGQVLRHYRRAAALTQEELAERADLSVRAISDLERGLRTVPQRETIRLLAQALDVPSAKLEAAVRRRRGPLPPSRLSFPSLSFPLTPLLGRERDEAVTIHLLQGQEVRLLTLTGPGGVGKTRLALQVAASLADHFGAGVALVELAPIQDVRFVLPAIAAAVGVRESGRVSLLQSTKAYLQGRELLLVLDNCEHLLDAGHLVVDLLAACSGLRVLATSRASLHVRGEHELEVLPLTVPDRVQELEPEALAQFPAIALFLQRARAITPNLYLEDETIRAVAEICRRLDGLPLAIELAASRTRLFPPEALLGRLSRSLLLLTGGARDAPARQQTLRNAIDWSYHLLPVAEQRLLARLSVFAGGFTLEAAEAVCNLDGSQSDLLDGVSSLVDKSLLRQQNVAGEPRFSMLQTIREYGLERLEESGEAELLRKRHAVFFVELAEQVGREFLRAGSGSLYGRAKAEGDDFRAALDWSQAEPGDTEMGLRLVAALLWFWAWGGVHTEGRAQAEAILARRDAAQHREAWAGALITLGALEQLRSEHTRAVDHLHESLHILHGTGDESRVGQALTWLGMTAMGQGDTQTAVRRFSEARDLARIANTPWAEATALSFLAELMVMQGDLDQVRSMAEVAVERFRALHDAWGTARMQKFLAGIAWMEGDYTTAHSLCAEAVDLLRGVGEQWNLGRALTRMGIILMDEGKYEEAEGTFTESLLTWRDLGNDAGMILSLAGLAAVAVAQEQAERALRLYAAEPFQRPADGLLLDNLSYHEFDHLMSRIRQQLGGRLPRNVPIIALEEAVSYALEAPSTGVSQHREHQ